MNRTCPPTWWISTNRNSCTGASRRIPPPVTHLIPRRIQQNGRTHRTSTHPIRTPQPGANFRNTQCLPKDRRAENRHRTGYFHRPSLRAPRRTRLSPNAARASDRGMRILCDYLVINGFLTKNAGQYALTPESAAFLDRRSPTYVGARSKISRAAGNDESLLRPSRHRSRRELRLKAKKAPRSQTARSGWSLLAR